MYKNRKLATELMKIAFLYPATKKERGIMLYTPKRLSVRHSVRPSALRFRTLT